MVEISIITHNGKFHTDEVTAHAILTKLYPNAKTIRTRDMKTIDDKSPHDFVIDVGNVYNHANRRYDHHHEEFNLKYYNSAPTPMSTAGLIWKHYGMAYLQTFSEFLNFTSSKADIIHMALYKKLIMEIDAGDNGVSQYGNKVKPKYYTNLSAISTIRSLFKSKRLSQEASWKVLR